MTDKLNNIDPALQSHITLLEENPDSDETFAYIAGYTESGVPYGVTWEEVGIDGKLSFEEKIRVYAKEVEDGEI